MKNILALIAATTLLTACVLPPHGHGHHHGDRGHSAHGHKGHGASGHGHKGHHGRHGGGPGRQGQRR